MPQTIRSCFEDKPWCDVSVLQLVAPTPSQMQMDMHIPLNCGDRFNCAVVLISQLDEQTPDAEKVQTTACPCGRNFFALANTSSVPRE